MCAIPSVRKWMIKSHDHRSKRFLSIGVMQLQRDSNSIDTRNLYNNFRRSRASHYRASSYYRPAGFSPEQTSSLRSQTWPTFFINDSVSLKYSAEVSDSILNSIKIVRILHVICWIYWCPFVFIVFDDSDILTAEFVSFFNNVMFSKQNINM